MSTEKAKAYYFGKDGHQKLNCAQAVVKAFQEKFSLSEETLRPFASFGGGRAPEGQCGALYAAKFILADRHPEAARECEAFFATHAGSTKCREIRSARKLSCLGCVEKAAGYLDAA